MISMFALLQELPDQLFKPVLAHCLDKLFFIPDIRLCQGTALNASLIRKSQCLRAGRLLKFAVAGMSISGT